MTETLRIDAPVEMQLHDGRTVTIRPLAEDDRAALYAFGMALPAEDWIYLEDDLQSPDIIARLINAHAAENWRQLVAVADGAIIGYSAVRRLPGWFYRVGDIQLVINSEWRRSGLGTLLAQGIFEAARDLGVNKVIVEMLEEQTAGQAIFERLGFEVEGRLARQACDRSGQLHTLLVMAYHVL